MTNPAGVTDDGTNKSVTIPATNSAQFFRLRRPQNESRFIALFIHFNMR